MDKRADRQEHQPNYTNHVRKQEDVRHKQEHVESNGHSIDQNHEHGGGAHAGHEQLFRRKFWISLVLSLPVLVLSKVIQDWLGFSTPDFPFSDWIVPIFSVIVFYIGGLLFFRMA